MHLWSFLRRPARRFVRFANHSCGRDFWSSDQVCLPKMCQPRTVDQSKHPFWAIRRTARTVSDLVVEQFDNACVRGRLQQRETRIAILSTVVAATRYPLSSSRPC